MGVHGLWKLIEPSGKVVPLESLEGKVLAVDISIWLHQAIKGFQDSRGASLPNAHLVTMYHRICKLLYFRIKPVFVFDGGVPALKRETITKRNQLKSKNLSEANDIQKQLISTLLKHSAVSQVLSETTKATLSSKLKKSNSHPKLDKRNEKDDLFVLPPSQTSLESEDSYDEEDTLSSTPSSSLDRSPTKYVNIHDIDEQSVKFRALPADKRHEILSDLKETRKQNSWGRIHELPKQSDDFAGYQMQRLLKRYSIQTCLEEAEKEMGGSSLSLSELESLLNDHGVVTENKGRRIASDENARYLYIKDVNKMLEEVKRASSLPEAAIAEVDENSKSKDNKETISSDIEVDDDLQTAIKLSLETQCENKRLEVKNKPEFDNLGHLEFEDDMKKAIKLSLQDQPSTSATLPTCTIPEPALELSQSSEISGSGESDKVTVSSSQQFNNNADFSTYLQSLRDSDFESSEGEILEQQQKPSSKVFSVARNYMIEYGGLTQSGIDEIFEEHNSQTRNKDQKAKVKFAKFHSKNREDLQSTNFEIVNMDLGNGDRNDINGNLDVALKSNSDSSSDDDFVEVPAEIIASDGKEARNNCIQIQFNAEDNLEDDIFDDIFNNDSKVRELNNQVRQDTTELPEVLPTTPLVNQLDLSVSDVENQKVIEESIKSAAGITIATNNKETPTISVSLESLKKLKSTLAEASQSLQMERDSKERLAGSITDQMYKDAQDLLCLFGIPYIVAPMEAEAQCAFLEDAQLTDGTITDDSDIWLFGGHTVYKNFFNHDKEVMEYQDINIQRYFKLNRYKLISLALLVGSDYTMGIQGIGPVTALEVLAAFTPKDDHDIHLTLNDFRRWLVDGKKVRGRGKAVLRNKLKNIQLHEGFPSLNVIKAYLEPNVDTSKETFSWGKVHRSSISIYAQEKLGWNRKKIDLILDPLMRRINDVKGQKRINDYFQTTHKGAQLNNTLEIQRKLSKRVKKALDNIGKGELVEAFSSSDEEVAKVLEETQKLSRQRKKCLRHELTQQMTLINAREYAEKVTQKDIGVKKPLLGSLHKKEVIPQQQIAKNNQLQARIKAIEVFRKSKQGPGYLKRRNKIKRKPKVDVELSDSSDSDDPQLKLP